MKIVTREFKTFSFSELSEDVKAKVIQKEREQYDFSFDQDCCIEDITRCASILGIEIEKFYYSGFYSQGDGASFVGSYHYAKGSVKAIIEYAPLDDKLHSIAKQLQALQKKYFYQIVCRTRQSGYYSHENTMFLSSLEVGDKNGFDVSDLEDQLLNILRGFAVWGYKQLEKEYNYQTSDKVLAEQCAHNTYLENGEIFSY